MLLGRVSGVGPPSLLMTAFQIYPVHAVLRGLEDLKPFWAATWDDEASFGVEYAELLRVARQGVGIGQLSRSLADAVGFRPAFVWDLGASVWGGLHRRGV